MKALKLEKNHLDGFVSILKKERYGRMHHRRKIAPGKAILVTANVSENSEATLFGRVTGPAKNHADYLIEVRPNGVLQINIDLEDSNGTYTLEQAYADICYGISQMMKKPHKPKFSDGRNTSLLYGYYLKSTGRNKVGNAGKRTFANALKAGHISEKFRDHCISQGFTMEYHQLKTPRQKTSTSAVLGVNT